MENSGERTLANETFRAYTTSFKKKTKTKHHFNQIFYENKQAGTPGWLNWKIMKLDLTGSEFKLHTWCRDYFKKKNKKQKKRRPTSEKRKPRRGKKL